MGEPARWFIGAATTTDLPETELDDRPELAGALHRMSDLFTSLGYKVVPGFGVNLTVAEFTSRLRTFLTSAERCEDDLVVVYYTGHGVLDQRGRLLLPMADSTDDLAFSALPAEDLTGRLLSGAKSVKVAVQRLLIMLDTCYAGAAGAPLVGGAVEYLNRLRGLTSSPSAGVVVGARPNEKAAVCAFSDALIAAVDHRASGGHEPEYLALDGVVALVNEQTPD